MKGDVRIHTAVVQKRVFHVAAVCLKAFFQPEKKCS